MPACRPIVNERADQYPIDDVRAYIPPLVVPTLLKDEMIGVDAALVVTQMTAVRIPYIRQICWYALVIAHGPDVQQIEALLGTVVSTIEL